MEISHHKIKSIWKPLILIMILAVICLSQNMYYAVNDDLNFRDLFSGVYMGTPESSLVIQWPLSSIFKWLFKTINGIDFWAYYLVFGHFVCWIVWIRSVSEQTGNNTMALLIVVFSIIVIDVPNAIFFQFTTAASVYAVTGMILLFDKSKNRMPEAVVFLGLTYITRRQNLIMILPFIGVILVMKLWEEQPEIWRIIKKEFIFLATMLFLVGGIFLVNSFLNQDLLNDTEYTKYREIREKIYDYEGVPDWNNYHDFYDSIGVSYGEYEAIRTHNTGFEFSRDISEILEDISCFNATIRQEQGIIEQGKLALGRIWSIGRRIMVFPQVVAVLLCMMVVTLLSIYDRQYFYLLIAAVGFGGAWMEIFLLAYKGRMPERVFQSIMMVALIWLLLVYGRIAQNVTDKGKRYIRVKSILLIGLVGINVLLLLPAVQTKQDEYAVRYRIAETVRQYGAENLDNIYITPYNFNSGNTDLLGHEYNMVFDNVIRLGLGIKSPTNKKKLINAGISTTEEDAILKNDNVYIMGMDKDDQLQVFHTYFKEKYQEKYFYKTIDVLDDSIYIMKVEIKN